MEGAYIDQTESYATISFPLIKAAFIQVVTFKKYHDNINISYIFRYLSTGLSLT